MLADGPALSLTSSIFGNTVRHKLITSDDLFMDQAGHFQKSLDAFEFSSKHEEEDLLNALKVEDPTTSKKQIKFSEKFGDNTFSKGQDNLLTILQGKEMPRMITKPKHPKLDLVRLKSHEICESKTMEKQLNANLDEANPGGTDDQLERLIKLQAQVMSYS